MANQITLNKMNLRNIKKKLADLESPMNRPTAEKVAGAVVDAMKVETANQRSPIRGFGPYEKLSPSYARFKKRKTGSAKADLRLSGRMIDSLRGEAIKSGKGFKARIDFSSSRSRELEGFHRETFPPRPLIPTSEEGFSKRISDLVNDILTKRIRKIINR